MMAEIITNACGCSVDWHKTHPLQSKINYCPKHDAVDDLANALYQCFLWMKTKQEDDSLSSASDGFNKLLEMADLALLQVEM